MQFDCNQLLFKICQVLVDCLWCTMAHRRISHQAEEHWSFAVSTAYRCISSQWHFIMSKEFCWIDTWSEIALQCGPYQNAHPTHGHEQQTRLFMGSIFDEPGFFIQALLSNVTILNLDPIPEYGILSVCCFPPSPNPSVVSCSRLHEIIGPMFTQELFILCLEAYSHG